MGMDDVFYDEGGPGEEDGYPWVFAPADSAFAERFTTEREATAYANRWSAARG